MRVLIIEDEKSLSRAIKELLVCEGFLVDTSFNGVDGLDNALSGIYDVIILDITLPKMNGFEVLQEIRRNQISSAVLLLTAKSETEDKVNGFKYGTDDYLTKPFATEELIARVWALTRRSKREYINESLRFADIELDRTTHFLKKDDNSIKLSLKEYQLMEILMLNKDSVVDREYCITKIWGYDSDIEYNSTDVYISFLRKKLDALNSKAVIKSVRGVGYSLGEKE
ncbi:MAG: response regulator transcription factor [Oscillospiraceae bacterium]|nr:response regulator transcription factor [Oscillospiraceae bacterium]